MYKSPPTRFSTICSVRHYSRRPKPLIVHKRGVDVLNDPSINKGTGWPYDERDRLGLRGLVPPIKASYEDQKKRVLSRLSNIEDPLEKYNYLASLQDRNETLFYSLLLENVEELAPIVYTPTVGEVCKQFSTLYRRARGMYFSLHDAGQMNAMVYNWPEDEVDVIVVTDGSRILGLGDLGVQGMGIPIGKTALYVVGGGIDPRKTLPITLDVGTNNDTIRNHPLYLGIAQKRISSEALMEFVDEFIEAITNRWPNVLIQFEDFSTPNALPLLNKYRKKHLVFNDDIQGTGSVAAAGILAALKQRGGSLSDLANENILVAGAGSAGMGVATSIAYILVQELNLTPENAFKRFYVVDEFGLLGRARSRPITYGQRAFIRDDMDDGTSLLNIIKQVKPTVLLGLSGAGGLFTEDIVKEVYKHCPKPIIFPMSNPTSMSECTAEDCYKWTEGNAIFASGSPFTPVTLPNGKVLHPSQANNMFIFPGLGLAVTALKANRISYGMLNKASIALSNSLTSEEIARGSVYPSIQNIRKVSLNVALAVAQEAYTLGICKVPRPKNLREYLEEAMWNPTYPDLIYRLNI